MSGQGPKTTTTQTAEIIGSIPEPEIIRQRLDDLRSEARILRDLLPVAERRQRLATRQLKQREGSAS